MLFLNFLLSPSLSLLPQHSFFHPIHLYWCLSFRFKAFTVQLLALLLFLRARLCKAGWKHGVRVGLVEWLYHRVLSWWAGFSLKDENMSELRGIFSCVGQSPQKDIPESLAWGRMGGSKPKCQGCRSRMGRVLGLSRLMLHCLNVPQPSPQLGSLPESKPPDVCQVGGYLVDKLLYKPQTLSWPSYLPTPSTAACRAISCLQALSLCRFLAVNRLLLSGFPLPPPTPSPVKLRFQLSQGSKISHHLIICFLAPFFKVSLVYFLLSCSLCEFMSFKITPYPFSLVLERSIDKCFKTRSLALLLNVSDDTFYKFYLIFSVLCSVFFCIILALWCLYLLLSFY